MNTFDNLDSTQIHKLIEDKSEILSGMEKELDVLNTKYYDAVYREHVYVENKGNILDEIITTNHAYDDDDFINKIRSMSWYIKFYLRCNNLLNRKVMVSMRTGLKENRIVTHITMHRVNNTIIIKLHNRILVGKPTITIDDFLNKYKPAYMT